MTHSIETQRLALVGARSEDWREYHAILAQPETSRFSNMPRKPSEKRTQGVVKWMIRNGQASTGYGWMIRELSTGRLVGCIRLNSIDKREATTIIGYELAKEAWGQGFATEALRAVVAHCHGAMQLRRLEAWTMAGNDASDRVLAKAGFRLEGVQREKMTHAGRRFDRRLFARLATDAGDDA